MSNCPYCHCRIDYISCGCSGERSAESRVAKIQSYRSEVLMTKKIYEFEDNVRFQDVDESKNESYYWVDGVLHLIAEN